MQASVKEQGKKHMFNVAIKRHHPGPLSHQQQIHIVLQDK